jgi:hypothetical protein
LTTLGIFEASMLASVPRSGRSAPDGSCIAARLLAGVGVRDVVATVGGAR